MSYANFDQESATGVMSGPEVTRQIKSLWRAHDELKSDVKNIAAEQTRQGATLAEIASSTRQIAATLSGPPPNRCVEHEMRIKAAEETIDDIDGRKQCEGCKNDQHISSLLEFKKLWEPRLWMGFGVLAFLQILIGVVIKWLH